MTASISATLGLLIFLCSLGAAAQPAPLAGDCQASPECARDLAAGVNDYQQRSYDTALALFEKAFARSNDARVLVLMGRTYFKRGDSRGALELYERAQPHITSAADRTKLEQYMSEARAATGGTTNQPAAESSPAASLHTEPAVVPGAGVRTDNPQPPAKERKTKPWVWAVVGVAAGAVVGTAVGLGVYYGTRTPSPDITLHFP